VSQGERGPLASRCLAELKGRRVAVAHDWLTGMRGGERCLEVFCELLPDADILTLFHFRGSVSRTIEQHAIRTSFLQKLPGLRRWYRHLLPLFPAAATSLDASRYDLVVSLSHCVAKGVGAGTRAARLCYCFTPMRYAWDQAPVYFNRARYAAPTLFAMNVALDELRRWDRATHADEYVAISRFVSERVRSTWGKPSDVVYPPVDVERFRIAARPCSYFLVVSALAPYKRIELAVEAANATGLELVVVGQGEESTRLTRIAGPSVRLLGWRSDEEVAELMADCRALILPGEEDFGITPLEAMAAGRPVIALGRGGAMETVVDLRTAGSAAPTGILFEQPSADCLADAMLELARRERDFEPQILRRHAERFGLPRFREEAAGAILKFVDSRRGVTL
jgi:glycosyltransferase involved in cell wall biosynthesis